jgi:hypothetical protein
LGLTSWANKKISEGKEAARELPSKTYNSAREGLHRSIANAREERAAAIQERRERHDKYNEGYKKGLVERGRNEARGYTSNRGESNRTPQRKNISVVKNAGDLFDNSWGYGLGLGNSTRGVTGSGLALGGGAPDFFGSQGRGKRSHRNTYDIF